MIGGTPLGKKFAVPMWAILQVYFGALGDGKIKRSPKFAEAMGLLQTAVLNLVELDSETG